MLLIACPWCGSRDESEFTYGGDAERPMPQLDGKADMADMAEWLAYVHRRGNPQGLHREFWHHTFGCERWLVVERDTVTHEITGARDAAAAADQTR